MEKIRLQKLIARYGYCSRRKAEELIKEGRVKVNGKTISVLGTKVPIDSIIEVDGKIINRQIKKIYIALNKPPGYLCTRSDDFGRKTIFDLIDKNLLKEGIFSAGRLDFYSRGLIILTNDGKFANYITHPSNNILKEYIVTLDGNIPLHSIESWKYGVVIAGEMYKIHDYEIISSNKARIILNEGKKREIRILFKSIGLSVIDLLRIKIGNLSLKNLKEGEYRLLEEEEIKSNFYNGH